MYELYDEVNTHTFHTWCASDAGKISDVVSLLTLSATDETH